MRIPRNDMSGKVAIIVATVFVCLIVVIIFFNSFMSGKLEQIHDDTQKIVLSATPKKEKVSDKIVEKAKRTGVVSCKIRLDPTRKFYRYMFYIDGQEIASAKMDKEHQVIEQHGDIPNGKVEFTNLTSKTHGELNYLKGKRNGAFKEYNQEDLLIVEAKYYRGNLLWRKEYYNTGVLKKDENYEDARAGKIHSLTGIGKFYSPDGSLKFEWRYIRSEKIGFNKSYNRLGELTKIEKYDENNQLIIPSDEAVGNP